MDTKPTKEEAEIEHLERLTRYYLQQLDCGYHDGECSKFAVIGIVSKYGDLFYYCREHGRIRALELLES